MLAVKIRLYCNKKSRTKCIYKFRADNITQKKNNILFVCFFFKFFLLVLYMSFFQHFYNRKENLLLESKIFLSNDWKLFHSFYMRIVTTLVGFFCSFSFTFFSTLLLHQLKTFFRIHLMTLVVYLAIN